MSNTPLHAAVAGGRTDVALLLIQRGAEVNAVDSGRHTPPTTTGGGGVLLPPPSPPVVDADITPLPPPPPTLSSITTRMT